METLETVSATAGTDFSQSIQCPSTIAWVITVFLSVIDLSFLYYFVQIGNKNFKLKNVFS
jgi:hypothetical protein